MPRSLEYIVSPRLAETSHLALALGIAVRSFEYQRGFSQVHLLFEASFVESTTECVSTASVPSKCYEACATLERMLGRKFRVVMGWWREAHEEGCRGDADAYCQYCCHVTVPCDDIVGFG